MKIDVVGHIKVREEEEELTGMTVIIGQAELYVSIDQETGALKIRSDSDGPGYTGRVAVTPIAPNSLVVSLERTQAEFVSPGVRRDLLEGSNFSNEIGRYGYDRYRIDDGRVGGAECRLWKVGENEASVNVHGGDPLHAAASALVAARIMADTPAKPTLADEPDYSVFPMDRGGKYVLAVKQQLSRDREADVERRLNAWLKSEEPGLVISGVEASLIEMKGVDERPAKSRYRVGDCEWAGAADFSAYSVRPAGSDATYLRYWRNFAIRNGKRKDDTNPVPVAISMQTVEFLVGSALSRGVAVAKFVDGEKRILLNWEIKGEDDE